jgi:Lrp/AsnC family leucine-responsive transcriptional regulator
VWVQIRHMQPEKKRKFLESLSSHPRVGWLAACGGKFDFAFSIMAEDSVTFSNIMRKILSDNPGIVQNYSITIATKIRSYPRTYLLEKHKGERAGGLFSSGPPQRMRLDKKDMTILSILSRDAKTPAVEIGKKIGMSTNAARMRVKKLEEKKVIQGYKAIFQPSVIGIQNYEILITTEGITAEKEGEVDAYCRSNPYITLFMSCIGRWDITLSVDIEGPQQLQQVLSEIRDRFGPVIRDFEYTPILHVYKFNLGES